MDLTIGTVAIGSTPLNVQESAKSRADEGFATFFNRTIDALNGMEERADAMQQRFVANGDVELQDVMIAEQESDLAFRLTMQVRNKALDTYREIMRMSV